MKKLITEVCKLPSGSLIPQMYSLTANGELDQGITHTLLDLISELDEKLASELEMLVSAAERGTYKPQNPDLPDWGINDKNVWLVSPIANPPCLSISNELIPDFSCDDGEPQQFTRQQFRQVLAFWMEFQNIIRELGISNMAGYRYESQFE